MYQLKMPFIEQDGSNEPHLTSRETEVLKFVVEGFTNRQTAAQMQVSIKTVEKHRQSLMNKLAIHDTAGLTRYAVTHGIVFDEAFRNQLREQFKCLPQRRGSPDKPAGNMAQITDRQAQVLKLIADGKVNKQIASELNVSIKTVDNHRQRMMQRLDIHEIAGLTRYAISQGMILLRGSPVCSGQRSTRVWV